MCGFVSVFPVRTRCIDWGTPPSGYTLYCWSMEKKEAYQKKDKKLNIGGTVFFGSYSLEKKEEKINLD